MTQDYVLRRNHLFSRSILNDVKCGTGVEAVIRFAGCNLSCQHCFSYASSWSHRWQTYGKKQPYTSDEAAAEARQVLQNRDYQWLRVTGGEPFLTLERVRELTRFLRQLENHSAQFRHDVVIQTNGLLLHDEETCTHIVDMLSDVSLDLLIEVSLKGVCVDEFTLLTGIPERGFDRQLLGIHNLQRSIKGNTRINYRLVMGFGPNNITESLPAYVFIHPNTHNLFLMKEHWDPRFEQVYYDYLSTSPTGDIGFAMACLVTVGWGRHAINNLDRRNLLLRTRRLSTEAERNVTRQWQSIHPYFVNMMPQRFYAREFP
jgi:uncharacterized Fe-S cluster-containing radical SAM superfamily protein